MLIQFPIPLAGLRDLAARASVCCAGKALILERMELCHPGIRLERIRNVSRVRNTSEIKVAALQRSSLPPSLATLGEDGMLLAGQTVGPSDVAYDALPREALFGLVVPGARGTLDLIIAIVEDEISSEASAVRLRGLFRRGGTTIAGAFAAIEALQDDVGPLDRTTIEACWDFAHEPMIAVDGHHRVRAANVAGQHSLAERRFFRNAPDHRIVPANVADAEDLEMALDAVASGRTRCRTFELRGLASGQRAEPVRAMVVAPWLAAPDEVRGMGGSAPVTATIVLSPSDDLTAYLARLDRAPANA